MIDKFGRKIDYLRISVTENCNLKCIYCIDENNILNSCNNDILTDDEIVKIATECARLGIKKIRITGGEPLVRKNIESLIYKLKCINGIEEIYITTNGVLLHTKIEDLKKNGLTGVNISLDSLNKDRFKKLTKFDKLQDVLLSIDKALELGLKVKINTVIVDDINKDEIIDFVNLTKDKNLDIRFIELMPIGVGKVYKGVSNQEIRDLIKDNFNNIIEIGKEKSSGPAKYIKVDDALGKVGFISAMSNCFCEECNRVRITPEGFLKQCLHFDYGISLRDLIRKGISDQDLKIKIEETIYNKPEKHLFNQNKEHEEIRFMNQIGG